MGSKGETETELIEAVLTGDRQAFVRLIERYQRLVQHVVFRMVKDQRDREELCQDVFLKVHRSLDSFRQEAKLSTWIARVARNTCLNHLEKKRLPLYADAAPASAEQRDDPQLMTRVPASADGPATVAHTGSVRDFVHAEIGRLPERYRTALTLYHLHGMSIDEISAVMDNPPGTVKSHLHRARKKLKGQLLARYDPEDLRP